MSPTQAAARLSDEDHAGYHLWLCGARSCAIAYARARALPEVARHLAARTEARYTPAAAVVASHA